MRDAWAGKVELADTEVVVEMDLSCLDGGQLPWSRSVGYSGEACDVIHSFIPVPIVVPALGVCKDCNSLCVELRCTLRICDGLSTMVVVLTIYRCHG